MNLASNRNTPDTWAHISSLACFLACCWMFTHPAWADESTAARAAPNIQIVKRFGIVWRIKGDVFAGPGDGATNFHPLSVGSPVYVGETVKAAATGEAVIKTDDAGIVAVRSGAEFIPERFVAEGKKTDSMILRLVTGSLRVITGWIGHLNRADDRIVTPTTTIGIRGTDHEPYVLSAGLAAGTQYTEGTYDKVNRGKTMLGEGGQTVEIESGHVGFARQQAFQTRGLMTILMPVLLDKVPDFYVPGSFDAELDQYSSTADAESARQLAKKQEAEAKCAPMHVAKNWLRRFDRAVVRQDAQSVISLFAPDVTVRANVRNSDGKMTSVGASRNEMVQSTIAAMKGLKHYRQRRLTLDATAVEDQSGAVCKRVSLSSQVIEQGEQAGKPYRFESTEEYLLEQHEGRWLAIRAETTQH
jgi:hypothetical protein